MAQNFRVGIVGAVSSYSLHYGRALHDIPDVELVGLAHLGRSAKYIKHSLNLPWLAKYPKTLDGYTEAFSTKLYETLEDMTSDTQLDGVCICTEDYLHQHYALQAVEQGLHVFVPKPFARSYQEAEAMFNAAQERNVTLVGSLPHRFNPASVTAQKVINEDRIGQPISGHFSIAHHISLGGWKSDPTMAAGPELEIGFYVFDLMRMMMKSEPKTVMGVAANLDHHGIPYIDNGKCLITCENGAFTSIDLICSMHQTFPPARQMHVIGNEGALTIEPHPDTGENSVATYTPDGVEYWEIPSWDSHERELTTWIQKCQNDNPAIEWQEEGLRTLSLICAYKQACESGGIAELSA